MWQASSVYIDIIYKEESENERYYNDKYKYNSL